MRVKSEGKIEFCLYVCLEQQMYDAFSIAQTLTGNRYAKIKVSHKGVKAEDFGRQFGEFSPLLEQEYLAKIENVIFSKELRSKLEKNGMIIACAIGNNNFVCLEANEFYEAYNLAKGIMIEKPYGKI